MNRRLLSALTLFLGVGLLTSCTDQTEPTVPETNAPVELAISDANRGGNPDFFWLPPTVTNLPKSTGQFDAAVLNQLVIEICQLNTAGQCTGPVIQRFAADEKLVRNQIRVHPLLQFYAAEWLTIFSDIKAGSFYRIRVLQNGAEIGFLDVQVVGRLLDLLKVNRSLYAPVIRGEIQPLWFRIQKPAAVNSVTINEVESNGGTPGDWIELHNSAAVPVSVAGYVVKDNDDTHSYTLPAGATIPAGGFLVIEEADLGFGLGAADAARLFTPKSATLVDSYTWTEHAATTYGRCPDGTGTFQTTTISTKGAANDCSVVIKINEVESNNGVPGDWVELYNPGLVARDLAGYVFKDNDDSHGYVLPAGSIIPAGGYLVLDEAAFGFGLGAADAARLFAPGGTTLVDSYEWTAHAATTYGRCPNGIGDFTTTAVPTKGAVNNCGAVATTVVINEIESSGGTPGDWVELYNTGTSPVDLSGYIFRDDDDTHTYVLPAGSIIAPGGYFLIEEAAMGFGLGTPDAARLFAPDGVTLVDSHAWTPHASTTYGRCPNGTGAFVTTAAATKGAANNCGGGVTATVVINEVESNGGTPGDWVELYNTGASPVDLSGYIFRDNDDTHTYVLPAGSIIAPGGYFLIEEAAQGFGLGSPDAARLFAPDGVTLVDSYDWTPHASTTYGRCPNGTGTFITTTSSTKGAANDCGVPVRINEVESNNGTPGDWVELYNPSPNAVDLSGFVFRDDDDTHNYVIPAGTTIAGNSYYLIEEAAMGFGLGAADAARLFAPGGVTLIDSYTWTAHATTTYGRCANGTGPFTTTTSPTKGAVNTCPGDIATLPWPGDAAVGLVDAPGAFPSNMSGLVYEGTGSATSGILWAARNGPGALFRLVWNGTIWTPDAANGWSAGKLLRYPDGTGDPDAEGVTFAGSGSAGGLYVSTERNNAISGVSRNSILRFDPSAAGTTLTATHEWQLTDLPPTGPNLGLEGIAWVPDAYLVAQGFFDESRGHAYNPAEYPNHAGGVFFVGVEANGEVYAYVLNHSDNSATRVATITSGFIGVMEVTFDRELGQLWAVCDDGCGGRTALLQINPSTGRFGVGPVFERPTGMPNLNNEGFAITPQAECVANRKPVYWADDSATDGHAIRSGTISCTASGGESPRIARRR